MQKQETDQPDSAFRVVIAGGGSAGWMTAAYLSKALEKKVEIRLIESNDIATVGVGEATFSTLQLFFDFLNLRERDWMPECNASYKTAIKFVDWNAERRHFYHPFQRLETVRGKSLAEWWLKCRRGETRFDYDCFLIPLLCDAKRSPRYLDGTVFDATVADYLGSDRGRRAASLDDLKIQYPYAYHFDARLFAQFLSRYAQKHGAIRMVDKIDDVILAPDGKIQALRTKEHGLIEADLFVDCTGFQGLLINQALKEPFISFAKSLPCDRAVAMQIPHEAARDGLNPYTQATALSAGWAWNIPLFNRAGTGYVYSSAFLSNDAAEQEFRDYLGPAAEGCRALHIKMRVGRNVRSWVKNCVAIGLSSGFVEPLESTGIFFIQHGVEQLASHFPRRDFDPEIINSYNKAVGECIDGVREFLILHYAASSRRDTPFWQATKEEIKPPAAVAERLRLWKRRLPTSRTINSNYHGFETYSYCVMLLGLGYEPESSLAILDHMCDAEALARFAEIRRRAEHLAASLPSHYDYLVAQYSQPSATVPLGVG